MIVFKYSNRICKDGLHEKRKNFENFNLFCWHFATFSEHYQNIIKTPKDNLLHENVEAIKNTLNKCLLKHNYLNIFICEKNIAIKSRNNFITLFSHTQNEIIHSFKK